MFDRDCEPNCTNADRFLPSAEVGWSDLTVYSDEDLTNTVFDCLRCHVVEGQEKRILRMQEIGDPWTHWFSTLFTSRILLDQYQVAHGTEDYAGIPGVRIRESAPSRMELLLAFKGFSEQPNNYNGTEINQDNAQVDTPNATWLELYGNAVDGVAIPPPYFGISPFDNDLVDDYAKRYREIAAGTRAESDMPDLTELYREDVKRWISFQPAANADATQIIRHACSTCHDGRFPLGSRSNFNVNDFPDNLTAEMRSTIVDRITQPAHSAHKMPPNLSMRLSPAEIGLIRDAIKE